MAYFAKFTERGQRALLATQKEAAQLGRTYVGTEHLLLGVLTEPGGAAARFLLAPGGAAVVFSAPVGRHGNRLRKTRRPLPRRDG